jgi:two-component system, cell cycle response regulator
MSPFPPSGFGMPDGIEVVELEEVDLDFAVEEAFRQGAAQALESTRTESATPEDLAGLELFSGVEQNELVAIAARSQSILAIPGYVLLPPGRLNTKVFFVLEGQLRLYPPTNDKRPVALVDVGHSIGLRSALAMQPSEHAVIATEVSHVVAVDVVKLNELGKRVHAFARSYADLQASYLRGDNCLYVGAHVPGATVRQGYIDELTLLHNQYWLDTMFSRLVARYRLSNKQLVVIAFAVDKHDEIVKQHGIAAGLRVLETVGHWTLDQMRPTDILAIDKNRHILAFVPECDFETARQIGGRLKTQIKSVPILITPDNAPTPTTITITLSVGFAMLEQGMKEDEFLNKANALIQKSTRLGGDWLSERL